MKGAKKLDEEALKTYPRLEQQNPGAFLPAMAGTLSNLGSLEPTGEPLSKNRAPTVPRP